MRTLDWTTTRSVLTEWLAQKMPAARDLVVGEISTPKGGGNSAETCLLDVSYLEDGARKSDSLVLRRQLEGDELFLDADMETHCRILQALEACPQVPTASLVGFELSSSVLGSPFFVMRRIEGRIVPQVPNYNIAGWLAELPPEGQDRVWRNGVEAMAKVHAIDWRPGFNFLDRPERGETGLAQYMNGIAEWHRWAARGRPQPVADAALDYLLGEMPANTSTGLVWGDAIPANILFADDLSVAGVIDWEAASLGPGEIDLGWWLALDEMYGAAFGAPRLPGLPDRRETVAIYEQAAGRKVVDIDYFEVLGLHRLAIIGTRQFDRQVNFKKVPATSSAYLANPMTVQIARRLGLPEPEVGQDFLEFVDAAISHQL